MTILDDIYDVALSRRPITIPRPPWSVIDPADHVVSARTWNELGRLPEALAYTATVAGNIMQAQADKTLDPLGAYARLASITADLVAMLAVALDLPIEGVQ